MEVFATIVLTAFTASLAALIVGVGLDAELGDLVYLFRHPLRLAKAVLSVNVVVPVAAALIVFLFPLVPAAKAGVLLMAVSPVPPLAPGKEIKAGASKPYAYGLYAALALLSVIIVPLTVEIFGLAYGRDVTISPAAVARNVAMTVILPLAVGLAVRRFAPGFARKALPVLKTGATILLFAALVPIVVKLWPGMADLAGNGTVAAMALVSVIALIAGHLLGGPEAGERAGLAFASATRHPGIALMIASANAADKQVTAAIVTFMLVGMIVALPYQAWLKRRAPQPAAA